MAAITQRRKGNSTYGKNRRRAMGMESLGSELIANNLPEITQGQLPLRDPNASYHSAKMVARHGSETFSSQSTRDALSNRAIRHDAWENGPRCDQLDWKHDEVVKRRKLNSTRSGESDTSSTQAPSRSSNMSPAERDSWNVDRSEGQSMTMKDPEKALEGRKQSTKAVQEPDCIRAIALRDGLQSDEGDRSAPEEVRAGSSEAPLEKRSDQLQCPSTPPRSIMPPKEPCITPRQRNMWEKLLTPPRANRSLAQGSISYFETQREDDQSNNLGGSKSVQEGEIADAKINGPRLIDALSTASINENDNFIDARDHSYVDSEYKNVPITYSSSSRLRNGDQYATGKSARNESSASVPPMQSMPAVSYVPSGAPITYAQQRSYLAEYARADELHYTTHSRPVAAKAPIASHFPAHPMTFDFADEDDFGGGKDEQKGSLRSVRELREVGGNARLVGAVESLLDELDHSIHKTSSQRLTLIHLATKLCDPENARLFVGRRLHTRIAERLKHPSDLVTNSIYAAILLLLLSYTDPLDVLPHFDDNNTKEFLINLLSHSEDLKTAAMRVLLRNAQEHYLEFYTQLLDSHLWDLEKPRAITGRILSLQCLRCLASWRQKGITSQQLLSGRQAESLTRHVLLGRTGTTAPSEVDTMSMIHAVFVFEAAVMSELDTSHGLVSNIPLEQLLNDLSDVGVEKHHVHTFQMSVLRLYFSLTETTPSACRVFAYSKAVSMMFRFINTYFRALEKDRKARQAQMDKAILSLLCFMNVIQASDDMRKRALEECDEGLSMLDSLLHTFNQNKGRAFELCTEEEIIENVPLGYLSVVLLFFCLDNSIKVRVQASMADHSLQLLLDTAEEFLKYHKAINEIAHSNSFTGGQPGFVDRVQGLLKSLTN